jgi:hypothetical protein
VFPSMEMTEPDVELRELMELTLLLKKERVRSTLIRIIRYIQVEDDCFIWQAASNSGSEEPVVWDSERKQTVGVIRWLYSHSVRPLRRNERAVNACGNRRCVSTRHAEVVSQGELLQWAWIRKRGE